MFQSSLLVCVLLLAVRDAVAEPIREPRPVSPAWKPSFHSSNTSNHRRINTAGGPGYLLRNPLHSPQTSLENQHFFYSFCSVLSMKTSKLTWDWHFSAYSSGWRSFSFLTDHQLVVIMCFIYFIFQLWIISDRRLMQKTANQFDNPPRLANKRTACNKHTNQLQRAGENLRSQEFKSDLKRERK